LTWPSGRDLHVRRLQVAVDDPFLVRRLERFGDLPRDRQSLAHRQRAAPQALGEVLALHELEDEERRALGLLDAVDGGDARVVERGEQLRLAPEAGEALRVAGHLGREHLDRHVARELRVGGAVDLAHPTRADRGGDTVVRERAADQARYPPNVQESSVRDSPARLDLLPSRWYLIRLKSSPH
jgi:hypothetical protein